jgi:protein-tyrosine-phosphatase
MANILIVCTANICRSPVAAALLEDRLRQRGLRDWTVRSAGTWAIAPREASRYSIAVTKRVGLDITGHRSRMVEESQLAEADLVLTMEDGHAEALRAEFPLQADKVYMLSEMIGQTYNIPDPYGGPIQEYERMYVNLSEVIDKGLNRIVAQAQLNANGRGQ